MMERITQLPYHLELLASMIIILVFNFSLLKLPIEDPYSSDLQTPLYLAVINQEEEYKVNKILNSRMG